MSTKSKLETLIGLGIVLLPLQGLAASPTEMTKDDWLGKLKEVAPTVICQGFFEDASLKKRMEELKIDNTKCVSLIPASFEKCQTQYYSSLPSSINKESASKWGHTIGECIGTDFATKYLVATPTPGSSSSSTDSSATGQPSEMPKDKWFAQLKSLAPSMICQGFFEDASLKKKLEDRNIDNTKCVSLISPSFEKCQTEFYSSLPATIDNDTANTWGRKIGECIGTDFAKKYLVNAPASTSTPADVETPSSTTSTTTVPATTAPSTTTAPGQ
ncbi:hypothetical protein [Legionella hackeliae]|uniref:T2SS substrate NttA domain-containing protein n=1 Tax=Legionella hackeliae TaxID=449 RepID=A0A0A8UW73_LEGHA|nr:hypothetical protein [Legionella hackeliae]KTD09669.1 hypothetical protein Lhac_2037 [Legionella hackeliae]CEK11014.1 conserved exported protein of unknown function [Legionella hackeliae]STX47756.1 Uncharacterised protein [Legionella hackeliae]